MHVYTEALEVICYVTENAATLRKVHRAGGGDVQETTSEYKRVLSAVEDATQEGEDLPPFPATHLTAALDAAVKVQSLGCGAKRHTVP